MITVMRNQTFKYFGHRVAIAVHCEGNDCIYPRITDRFIRVWVDGQLVKKAAAGQHQGYDANRHVRLTPTDVANATRFAYNYIVGKEKA